MKMLIAGGGTGGHLYPGVALAEDLLTRQKGNEVLFVGTARGIEARVVPELGYPLELVPVEPLKGRGLFGLIKGLLALPRALLRSLAILDRFQPDFAVGVGGYASGPMMVAAFLRRVPRVVLEQNTVPGITNRILAHLVDAVFVSFRSSEPFFPKGRTQLLGNPIRQKLLENFLKPKVEGERFVLLVVGGSQGAHALNVRMAEASPRLASRAATLTIIHQTGTKDEVMVREAYAAAGIQAEVSPFIEDMGEVYRRADLVVCRAGATTIAELLVSKKASILVPFPFAANNHQELNAREVVERGAARMILERDLDGGRLADEIGALMDTPDTRRELERAAGRAGRPEATREIVEACVDLARRRRKS